MTGALCVCPSIVDRSWCLSETFSTRHQHPVHGVPGLPSPQDLIPDNSSNPLYIQLTNARYCLPPNLLFPGPFTPQIIPHKSIFLREPGLEWICLQPTQNTVSSFIFHLQDWPLPFSDISEKMDSLCVING